jgi:hypothetical protein
MDGRTIHNGKSRSGGCASYEPSIRCCCCCSNRFCCQVRMACSVFHLDSVYVFLNFHYASHWRSSWYSDEWRLRGGIFAAASFRASRNTHSAHAMASTDGPMRPDWPAPVCSGVSSDGVPFGLQGRGRQEKPERPHCRLPTRGACVASECALECCLLAPPPHEFALVPAEHMATAPF